MDTQNQVASGGSVLAAPLGQSREPLTNLPQLLGHGVVSSSRPNLLQRAAGEVASAERLQALPQGAVQHRLGAAVGIGEEQLGRGQQEQLQPDAEAASQVGADHACDTKTPETSCPAAAAPAAVRSLTWVQAVAGDGGSLQPVG